MRLQRLEIRKMRGFNYIRSTVQCEYRKRGEETGVSRIECLEKSVRGDVRSKKTRKEKVTLQFPFS